MRILITNDDGIDSAGILALAEAAAERGHEVLISAPESQCSANSQHITLRTPILTKRRTDGCFAGMEAYAVSGTPADCVRISGALFEGKKPELCLSGVNNGENAGSGIYYSGTFAAAREAAMMYIPAFAVSIRAKAGREALYAAARHAVEVCGKMAGMALPRMTVVNLNYPRETPEEWRRMVLCPQSTAFFVDNYIPVSDPRGERLFWLAPEETIEPPEEGSDLWYLRHATPTCTLIGGLVDHNGGYAAKMQEILQ